VETEETVAEAVVAEAVVAEAVVEQTVVAAAAEEAVETVAEGAMEASVWSP
jgi:hypothetical protein